MPENRSGLIAIQRVAACVCSGRQKRTINPLYVHGPSGTGKTLLIGALVDEVARCAGQLAVNVWQASDFATLVDSVERIPEEDSDRLPNLRQSKLLIVEDLQRLPARGVQTLVALFDDLFASQSQMVFTAAVGPRLLGLPARLTSRLASGLVIGLEPLQAASRLAILQDSAQRRQLAVSREVLAWLAERLGGSGRQLEGALTRLETLARVHPGVLDVAAVSKSFGEQADYARPTVERILQKVGGYFQVAPRELQSSRRTRNVVLPRQVSMYLARQLTNLSLHQIGAYFGGRDHSTVLHACRKLEEAAIHDAVLSGTIRQLQAGLT